MRCPRGEERAVTQPDHYLLGCSDAEKARLKRQSAALAPESDAQFEMIGIKADLLSLICDPPNPEWTRLLDAYKAYSAAQGIDLCVGRRTHRLFRAAGVVDIHVDAIVRVYPAGDHQRLILWDFINNVREKLIDEGFIGRSDLERDVTALERHLSNPEVLVTSHLFFRLSGRVPQSG